MAARFLWPPNTRADCVCILRMVLQMFSSKMWEKMHVFLHLSHVVVTNMHN